MMLEIGSVLYSQGFGCGFEKFTISRVTEKRAYVKINDNYEFVFDRDTGTHTYAKKIGGGDGLGRATYFLETPELKAKYKLSLMRRKFDSINSSQLTTEQLEQILAIVFPKKAAV